jgi:pyrimidine operon attenuation protein/uracil phosphoribosyltransferase
MSSKKNYILDESVAVKKLRRMALEIVEKNIEEKEIILAGIKGSGTVVAKNIQQHLSGLSAIKTTLLTIFLDKKQPQEITLSEKIDLSNKVIIVIDDVANSGRTLLYSLKPLLEFHPKKIQTLVLVERKHNNFPVCSDYVGLSVATTLQEHIVVEVNEEKVLGAYME